MGYEQEMWSLRNRVRELEKQVEHLRISRRVLMNLIERIEREKRTSVGQLEKENKRLQYNNQRYAQWLMKCNYRFVELETRNFGVKDNDTNEIVNDYLEDP